MSNSFEEFEGVQHLLFIHSYHRFTCHFVVPHDVLAGAPYFFNPLTLFFQPPLFLQPLRPIFPTPVENLFFQPPRPYFSNPPAFFSTP